MRQIKHIHFIGNIEGRDVLLDKADVMVCDGFTGNIILKLAESLYDISKRQNLQMDISNGSILKTLAVHRY